MFDAYLDGATIEIGRTRAETKKTGVLTDEEAAVVGLIEQRLRKTA